MNKFSKMTVKLAIVQIGALLLAACANLNTNATLGNTADTNLSNICHATGDPLNPYEEITITNDIYPVPVNGCPASAVEIADGKVTICHATGSETDPYNKITVSANGLNGHGTHEGDIIAALEGDCPAGSGGVSGQGSGESVICHATDDLKNPYEEIPLNDDSLAEHVEHPNDINPLPVNGCPETLVVIVDGEITICHASGDTATPYEEVTVSVNGLDGHGVHEGDLIPVADEGCPASPVGTDGDSDKITICHATSSKKNPYNEITISVNGLNGHDKHDGDIIPAPEGGCPATK